MSQSDFSMAGQLSSSPEPECDGIYAEIPSESKEESGKYIFQSIELRYLENDAF